jgi:hypothetical protein
MINKRLEGDDKMGYDLSTHCPTGNYKSMMPDNFDDLPYEEQQIWELLQSEAYLSNGNYMYFNLISWPLLLILASDYGWEPMGTINPYPFYISEHPELEAKTNLEWHGDYCGNASQTVTAQDALNLAAALERALDDIPDYTDVLPKMIGLKQGETCTGCELYQAVNRDFSELADENQNLSIVVPDPHIRALEYFGGENKHLVKNFIIFCRKGAFYIG